jgi:hypothetical protein
MKQIALALSASSLRRLPPLLRERLVSGAPLRTVTAGTTTQCEGEPPFLEMVVSGLIRGRFFASIPQYCLAADRP